MSSAINCLSRSGLLCFSFLRTLTAVIMSYLNAKDPDITNNVIATLSLFVWLGYIFNATVTFQSVYNLWHSVPLERKLFFTIAMIFLAMISAQVAPYILFRLSEQSAKQHFTVVILAVLWSLPIAAYISFKSENLKNVFIGNALHLILYGILLLSTSSGSIMKASPFTGIGITIMVLTLSVILYHSRGQDPQSPHQVSQLDNIMDVYTETAQNPIINNSDVGDLPEPEEAHLNPFEHDGSSDKEVIVTGPLNVKPVDETHSCGRSLEDEAIVAEPNIGRDISFGSIREECKTEEQHLHEQCDKVDEGHILPIQAVYVDKGTFEENVIGIGLILQRRDEVLNPVIMASPLYLNRVLSERDNLLP